LAASFAMMTRTWGRCLEICGYLVAKKMRTQAMINGYALDAIAWGVFTWIVLLIGLVVIVGVVVLWQRLDGQSAATYTTQIRHNDDD